MNYLLATVMITLLGAAIQGPAVLEIRTRMWASTFDTSCVTSGAIFDRSDGSVRDDDATGKLSVSQPLF